MCKNLDGCDCDTHNPQKPGKFENEPAYAVHFWNMGIEGMSDREDENYFIFDINADDVSQFPELKNYTMLQVYEDENGFVYVDIF